MTKSKSDIKLNCIPQDNKLEDSAQVDLKGLGKRVEVEMIEPVLPGSQDPVNITYRQDKFGMWRIFFNDKREKVPQGLKGGYTDLDLAKDAVVRYPEIMKERLNNNLKAQKGFAA